VFHELDNHSLVHGSLSVSNSRDSASGHLVKATDQHANLLFSVTAISVASIAACELLMIRAQTTEQFGTVLRWAHLPVFFAVVSVVGFVRFYFRVGRHPHRSLRSLF
jgi:hypothetical protein